MKSTILVLAIALVACGMWFMLGYRMGKSSALQVKSPALEIAGAGDQGIRKVRR